MENDDIWQLSAEEHSFDVSAQLDTKSRLDQKIGLVEKQEHGGKIFLTDF